MPPFVARKRRLSTLSSEAPTPKKAKKPTLFDTVDQGKPTTSISENQKFLDDLDNGDSETSLSEANSSDFEDALPQQRRKVTHHEEEDEEVDWEDAIQPEASTHITPVSGSFGDLELTITKDHRNVSLTNPNDKKKGPSKIERQIRTSTHCMHVQFLLFHNLLRNAWICDKEVQSILLDQLPCSIIKEVKVWSVAVGVVSVDRDADPPIPETQTSKGRGGNRGIGRGKNGRIPGDVRSQREWGRPAERQEKGIPNLSRGDPVIRLLRYLAAYWKQRFRITAPGLRKQGYKSLVVLEKEIISFHNDRHDVEEHGEKIDDLNAFRQCARRCEGSRDIGAQLFTALVRGLGIEARIIASLQPIGFGWSKSEEANTKKTKLEKKKGNNNSLSLAAGNGLYNSELDADGGTPSTKRTENSNKAKLVATEVTIARTKTGKSPGRADTPADLLEESQLSSVSSSDSEEDDESVIDITPSMPQRKPNTSYDKDARFPNYWTEVISPLTHEVYPVDSLILTPPVATKQELLAAFEPRGAKAEKAKQVIAYIVAYSADGTAKDVTTRYLKRHMWPGETKAVRLPIEKVPVLNERGKVKHHEERDWFKTVMSGYKRSDSMRTVVDDLEENDLRVIKPEKKQSNGGEETLQGYKQSAEFVLERHLRREEAVLPGSEPVKMFTSGKGDNATEEPVYRRKDVVICRTGESWHKEGRQVKAGEYPMKMVPVRAVTLMRKRELEEAQRDGGEKMKQGLYGLDQTEWIIPPPIQNGVIPKNAFGNMDCYVPTMVPQGASHIPLRGTMKICKRLGIDFAEAVTGFEFGNQRAVPVITGVVIASEHEDVVIDEWKKDEAERKIKEEGKREKVALSLWRKFLMGLRIIERVREEYGDDDDAHMREEMNPFTNKNKISNAPKSDPVLVNGNIAISHDHDAEFSGGFLPENEDQEIESLQPPVDREDMKCEQGGGFVVEDTSVGVTIPARKTPKFRFTDKQYAPMTDGEERARGDELNEAIVVKPVLRQTTSHAIKSNSRDKSSTLETRFTEQTITKPEARRSRQTKRARSEVDTEVPSSKVTPKLLPRATPKRKAARKSETALKSQYFAGTDTDEDEKHPENSTSEDDDVYEAATHKGKKPATVTGQLPKAKRGRPRKTL